MKRRVKLIYDTSKFKKLLADHGYSVLQFSTQVAELCNKPVNTIRGYVMGYNASNEEAITAYSAVLDVPEEEIRKLCYIRNSDEAATTKESPKYKKNGNKKTTRTGGVFYKLNKSVLEKKYKGVSVVKLSEMTGVGEYNIYYWCSGGCARKQTALKFADALGVEFDKLFTCTVGTDENVKGKASPAPVTDAKAVTEKKAVKAVNDAKSKKNIKNSPEPAKLVAVDGVLQVFDVFRIINGNLGLLYDAVNKGNAENNTSNGELIKKIDELSKNDGLINKIDELSKRLEALEKSVTKMNAIAVEENVPRDERETPAVVVKPMPAKNLIFNPDDTIDEYAQKIDVFIKKIASREKLTLNQVRHDSYNVMQNTYGVVWSQLQKDYYAKHGKRNTWSLALLHDNGLFGQIYFNILKTESEKKAV